MDRGTLSIFESRDLRRTSFLQTFQLPSVCHLDDGRKQQQGLANQRLLFSLGEHVPVFDGLKEQSGICVLCRCTVAGESQYF